MTYNSPSAAYAASDPVLNEAPRHAICWQAIFGGVFVALAITVVLTILGSGLGLAIKPMTPGAGPSLKTLGVVSVIWIILVEWAASALGGYIAGRLRTRWVSVHTHEVFFRDTAHGFITWATATVLTMVLLTSATAMLGHGAARMAAHPMYAYAHSEDMNGKPGHPPEAMGGPFAYYTDMLFRGDHGTAASGESDAKAEASRILAKSFRDGSVSEEDRAYLEQLVSSRTGMTASDAGKRVNDVVARENVDETQMREVAENARKSASVLSICIALSLLIGAFVSSISAALGGNIRDRHN